MCFEQFVCISPSKHPFTGTSLTFCQDSNPMALHCPHPYFPLSLPLGDNTMTHTTPLPLSFQASPTSVLLSRPKLEASRLLEL
jgi:hypothetical protein